MSTWNTAGNWLPAAGFPGAGGDTADTVTFSTNDTGTSANATTVNNVVSANVILSSLTYNNTNMGATAVWNVTDIQPGVTLTVTNLTMGGQTGSNFVNDVAFVDGGTLAIHGNWTLGDSGSVKNSINTDTLGGLSNLVYNASSGSISIGFANFALVNLTLAATNNITAGTINVNTTSSSSSSGSQNTLILGGSTNIINVGAFNVAAGRNSTTMEFPSGDTTSGLLLRGVTGGSSLANVTVGNHNTGGSSGSSTSAIAVDGNPVNMNIQTLALGENNGAPTAVVFGTGIFSFDTGTVYASNILLAVNTGTSANAEANGTMNVGSVNSSANPTLIIGSGMNMLTSTNTVNLSSGTLNITNATVICSNSIVRTSTAVGLTTITMTNGDLDMVSASGTVGTSTAPISFLVLSNSFIHLNVNGTSAGSLYGTNVTASGMNIVVDSVANVIGSKTIPIITYSSGINNPDPFSGFNPAVSAPLGYTASLSDDTGAGQIDLTIQQAGVSILGLTWVGAVGSTLNNNWDFTTLDWLTTNGVGFISINYTNPDVVLFDDAASNANVNVTQAFGPGSLTVSNSVLNYVFSGSGSITGAVALAKWGTGSLTMSESGGDSFSGGVAVNNNGEVILDDANSAISGGLNISSGATAQIGTNDNNGSLPAGLITDDGTLIFDHTTVTDNVATAISGSGALIQNGSGSVSLSAANSYTGVTTVNAGTLALTGSGSISNSSSVTFNNAALNISGLTGSALMQTVTFNNSTQTLALPNQSITPLSAYSGAIILQGATNIVNVTVLPPIAYFPTTLTLMSGAVNGSFNMGLGTLTNGYHGTLSEGPNNVNVLLTLTGGPVGVRPSVSWVGTDAVGSGVTNWSDADNWMLPGPPTPVDNVDFADVGTAANTPFNGPGDGPGGIVNPQYVNNFLEASYTIGALTYTNITAGDYQNTFIQNGHALNVVSNGSLVVGSESTDYGSGATIYATIGGTNGTLNVNNTNGTMFVGIGSASVAPPSASLDLSGLGTFNANVSRLLVGVGGNSEGISLSRNGGILYLAQTNTITASIAVSGSETSDTSASAEAVDIGDADGNAGNATLLYLGHTNAIYADAIAVGRQKEVATMEFNVNFQTNTVYFRGASASAVGTFSIGDGCVNSGSGENANGTCDFTAGGTGSDGYVNALIGTLYVGRTANNLSGSGTVNGTLNFDNGIFNVGTMFLGYNPTNVAKTATGTVNVNTNSTLGVSGTLSVSGNLFIAQTPAGGTAAAGTLNIGGGTVTANSIVCDAHGGNSTITLGNSSLFGTLSVANTIGAPGAPLTTLNLDGGTLELNVNGFASETNIVATSVTTSGATTLQINFLYGVQTGTAYPLISYTGTDPYGSLTLAPLPAGFTGTLVDNTANDRVDLVLTVVPPVVPPSLTIISVSGNTLTFSATNGEDGAPYTLYGTTNLAPPVVWKPVFTNNFSANGIVNLSTNVITTNTQSEFFKLQEP